MTTPIADTTTANGAPSYSTTLDPRLDLFIKTTRNVCDVCDVCDVCVGVEANANTNTALYAMIDKSWLVDPLDTMKILMNWRDCRGGKGDYHGFIVAMTYIDKTYNEWFIANFKIIPEYGSWLDLVKLWHFCTNESKQAIMDYIVVKLEEDLTNLDNDDETTQKSVSLLAKWIPSENSKWDRYGSNSNSNSSSNRFIITLCKNLICDNDAARILGRHIKLLRKQYLTPLRAHLAIVESKMCAKQFDNINYETVPSVAMKKYRNAFMRNDKEGFSQYMQQVKSGEKKINASQVYPHDLVRHYLNQLGAGGAFDPVIEEQWASIKKTVKETGSFDKSICVCDVSGSMHGTPMEVAIALGLLGLYNDQVITFSDNPQLHKVTEETLQDQVSNMVKMEWGMSTNFEKTMDLVLNLCLNASAVDDHIKRVFIFSDMQFNVAIGDRNNDNTTLFQTLRAKFAKSEIKMPQIIFWNLSGQTNDFPVTTDENGVVMFSGYSPSLLTALVDGDDVSPMTMLLKVIRGSRYDKVCEIAHGR